MVEPTPQAAAAAAVAPAAADVEAHGGHSSRSLVAVALPEQINTKPRAWPFSWACRGSCGRTIATVLLALTALGFVSASLVLSQIWKSIRALPPQTEQEAIVRQAVLVGGDLPRPDSPGDRPTPVRVHIKKLADEAMDVYTQVCMGIDLHNGADEWMEAAKHDRTAASWVALAGPKPAAQVYESLSLMTDRWAQLLVHAALRRLYAAEVQLGPTRVSQALPWQPSPLPEFKLDPVMDSVCPAAAGVSDAQAVVQTRISKALESVSPASGTGMFDITFEPVLVPLRPVEGTTSCGSLPSRLGKDNITLYPVHVKAHVVPISEVETMEQELVHVQPSSFPGHEQRVMADVHVKSLDFAAFFNRKAVEAMQQWSSLPDVPQGPPDPHREPIGHLSTWTHGSHGAIHFRISAPLLRGLRCLSGIEGPDQDDSGSNGGPSGGWWDRMGKQVKIQLSSATFNPIASTVQSASSSKGGLAWKVAVQVTSPVFDPFEIEWPFSVPVEVALPMPSSDAGETPSRTLAKVDLLPFSLSNGSVIITLQGEVNRLPDIELPGSTDVLDKFLAGLLQGQESLLIVRGRDACEEHGEGMPVPNWLCSLWRQVEYALDLAPLAALIPRPGDPEGGPDLGLPEILQNPSFENVTLRPHPFGPHKLTITADFTAEVRLPAELDPVDMHLHAIWPDMILISLPSEEGSFWAGRNISPSDAVPGQLAGLTFLPALDNPANWIDVPSEPNFEVPDPLPSGAFAHIRLPAWAATSLTWLPREATEKDTATETVRVLHARFIDAPLDALPGQSAELRKFLWDVTRGDVTIQALGEAGVRASLPALGPHITTLLAVPIVLNVTVDRA